MTAPNLDDYVDVAERIREFYDKWPDGSLRAVNPGKPWELAIVTGADRNGTEITQTFIVYTAAAYRNEEDQAPAIGCAWEVFPGRTPYTRGSELMNAETSAWGRAIAALGIATKRGIASREEVDFARQRNAAPEVDEHGAATFAEQTRMITGPVPGTSRHSGTPENDPWYDAPGPLADAVNPEDRPGTASVDQLRSLNAGLAAAGVKDRDAKHAWINKALGLVTFADKIHSSKDLSYSQAARALQLLEAETRARA